MLAAASRGCAGGLGLLLRRARDAGWLELDGGLRGMAGDARRCCWLSRGRWSAGGGCSSLTAGCCWPRC